MSTKVKGKIAPLNEWLAPWEKDDQGRPIAEADQEIDAERLKRYLHGLLVDKEKTGEQIATFEEAERTRKEAEEAAEREGETEVQRLQREIKALQNAKPEKTFDAAEAALDIIADEYKHLTVSQARKIARRVAGKDEDSVKADLADLLETAGLDQAPDGETEQPDPLRGQPKVRRRAAGDPERTPDPTPTVDINTEFPPSY